MGRTVEQVWERACKRRRALKLEKQIIKDENQSDDSKAHSMIGEIPPRINIKVFFMVGEGVWVGARNETAANTHRAESTLLTVRGINAAAGT